VEAERPEGAGLPRRLRDPAKAVLQVTDIKTNHNKYYAIEVHQGTLNSKPVFRVFTHYGRTDDLEKNPEAGQKECRYASTLGEAQAIYDGIYREKTSSAKGYKELSLASSKIGSQKARGTSAGEIDAKTVKRLAEQKVARGELPAATVKVSTLHPTVQQMVQYIYAEATNALTTAVNVKITANGIETPLGILTVGQIEKGESILQDIYKLFQQGSKNRSKMIDLSGDFYTTIPHRIGRTRAAIDEAVIDTMEDFQAKQETLQLMKDMLQVNGDGAAVLFESKVDEQYDALGAPSTSSTTSTRPTSEIEQHVLKSQCSQSKNIKVKNIYTLRRAGEHEVFTGNIDNQRLLFHGSAHQELGGHPVARHPAAEDRGQHGRQPHRRGLARQRHLLRRRGVHERGLHVAGQGRHRASWRWRESRSAR
jgi:hypothetical protein